MRHLLEIVLRDLLLTAPTMGVLIKFKSTPRFQPGKNNNNINPHEQIMDCGQRILHLLFPTQENHRASRSTEKSDLGRERTKDYGNNDPKKIIVLKFEIDFKDKTKKHIKMFDKGIILVKQNHY